MADASQEERAKEGTLQTLKSLGENPLPATILATLITAQSLRPFRALPMLFPPVLLLSSYLNVGGFKADSAGITAAWSGIYFLLAARRKAGGIRQRFGTRGIVRGATLGMCVFNVGTGAVAYTMAKRRQGGEKRAT
ncbi:MAG: hypothetical protein Q9165_000768 [Trypethelium subeluteriae]